jgi:hypothetical protein
MSTQQSLVTTRKTRSGTKNSQQPENYTYTDETAGPSTVLSGPFRLKHDIFPPASTDNEPVKDISTAPPAKKAKKNDKDKQKQQAEMKQIIQDVLGKYPKTKKKETVADELCDDD